MEQNRFQQYSGAQNVSYGAQEPSLSVNAYAVRTFLWMFVGLLITFGLAAGLAYTGALESFLASIGGIMGTVVVFVPLIAVLVIAFILSARLQKMSVTTARVLFFVYSAIMGFTMSFYFIIYDVKSISLALGVTALFFGTLAALSYFMKWQLQGIAPVLFAGLIALIVLSIVAFFVHMPMLNLLISYLGVAVFLGYTAYDTAKIRDIYYSYSNRDSAMLEKASIFAAFQLYLDFLNLFIYILRILGHSRD